MALIYTMDISVAQAKDQFSRCLSKAEAGQTITIRKHGKPVARIMGIPEEAKNRIQFGTGRGTVKIKCDLTEPAFDPEDWECL